ncbi:hydrolase [Diplonema papillatum]|nr:hydrolase [Diplonema papillatum]
MHHGKGEAHVRDRGPASEGAEAVRVMRLRSGVRLEYQLFGSWTPAERAVVLVPDAGEVGIGNVWPEDTFTRKLVQAGCSVVRFNMRDTGRSTHFEGKEPVAGRVARCLGAHLTKYSPPYTAADVVDDISDLLHRLCIPACHMVGAGVGAAIAQEFLAAHAAQCISLTVISGLFSACSRRCFSRPKLCWAVPRRLAQPGCRRSVTAFHEAQALAESKRPYCTPGATYNGATLTELCFQTIASFAAPAGGTRRESPLATVRACAQRQRWCLRGLHQGNQTHKTRALLLRCRKPVLVVHGTDDAATPVDRAVAFSAAVASADLLLLKGVAHDLPDSHAGVVAAAIVRLVHRATRADQPPVLPDISGQDPATYTFYPSSPADDEPAPLPGRLVPPFQYANG